MLHSVEVVDTVVSSLADCSNKPLMVVDPVLVSSSGDSLGGDGVAAAIKEKLLPLATLVTPNLQEAAALTGRCCT